MKLYNNVERIYKEIKEFKKDKTKFLSIQDLIKFDQLHYNGIKAVDFAIKKTKVRSNKDVLEIGSGIGGPSRYLAYKTKASITALELQNDQNKVAKDLTKRCKLSKFVNHIKGDILNYNWGNKKFDIIVSWLTLYHIKDRNKLLDNCNKLIKKNGYFFAEDIISEKKLSINNLNKLSNDLYANYLPTYEQYLIDLKDKGFKIIYHRNMSNNWSKYVKKRKFSYIKNKDRHIRVHGKNNYKNIRYFYNVVDKYFSSNKIGGIRIVAKKN
tara:strand:+ start:410 stop:1213 length:804 start_codon:yes stop_codon:yes gene_type:complete